MPELTLHKSLYDGPAVHAVAAQYRDLATITVDEGEHELLVRFEDIDPDVQDVLLDHFGNHVLVESLRSHVGAEQALLGEVS